MSDAIVLPTASNFKNLAGMKFGRLTVVSFAGRNNGGSVLWLCRCECGNPLVARSAVLSNGHTKSCGCLNRDRAASLKYSHGMSGTSEYLAWQSMNKRCYDKNHPHYDLYGERGIAVCDEWRHDFQAFFASVGSKPSRKHSLDRIDVNGNYEPGNVRWATQTQQMRNTRKTIFLTANGETKTLAEWSEETKISYGTLYHRVVKCGLGGERALAIRLVSSAP